MDAANRELTADSRRFFENPYTPLAHPDLAAVDELTVKQKLDSIDMTDEARALMESFWCLNFNGRIEDGAYTQALRWAALTNGDWAICFEACATYKFEGGTKALIDAMVADVRGEILLNTPVFSIDTSGASAIVTTQSGDTYEATSVIVTVGLHALANISFVPHFSATREAAIGRGQASRGTKVWIKVAGAVEPFVAFGAAEWPLNFFQTDVETPDGNRLLIGFGPDQSRIDPLDKDAVAAVLHRLRPDLDVLDVHAHDWVNDELSQQTWPMHRPGFLSESLASFQETDGQLILAGSDFANGWGGFIDGAIESGLTAAHTVLSRKIPNNA
jgi:monoamine oxidase